MSAANSSGEEPIGVAPSIKSRSRTAGSFTTSAQSRASFALIAGGRPAGARMPPEAS